MRVQTEEWRRFIPGVRMYKGKKTLFYNGEKLYDEEDGYDWEDDTMEFLVHDKEERDSWQVIVVLPGVEVISDCTFYECKNVETVIMADTVQRIEKDVFYCCESLVFVKLSTNLEYIGTDAFCGCESLTSIFIPLSCRQIGEWAFHGCRSCRIAALPQHTELGRGVFQLTGLMKNSPFEFDQYGFYNDEDEETVIQWIKSINNDEAYALHRACASFNPLAEIIHALVQRQGLKAMRIQNKVGISPSQYLEANTFADMSEKDIINRFVLDTMGEIV